MGIKNNNDRKRSVAPLMAIALAAAGLSACSSTVDRLTNISNPPPLTAIKNPTTQPGYKPVRLPMPEPIAYVYQPNSLWRSGARAFFEDQRASRIGDILTVDITIDDKAQVDNATTRTRTSDENMGIDQLAGFGTELAKILPNMPNLSDLIDVDSTTTTRGSGDVEREEEINTNVAAVVTQVLPNGNLVIEGRQEIRVNFEVREIIVAGIVRPEDISAENTIDSKKIAEARISYGGRGHITDVQQPRYGQQFLDILLPF